VKTTKGGALKLVVHPKYSRDQIPNNEKWLDVRNLWEQGSFIENFGVDTAWKETTRKT